MLRRIIGNRLRGVTLLTANYVVWILATGSWNDSGVWVDSDVWKDS